MDWLSFSEKLVLVVMVAVWMIWKKVKP